MPKAFAALVDEVEDELEDTGNVVFSAAKIGSQLERVVRRDFSKPNQIDSYIRRESYDLETRTGTATTDTANALVDSAAQFLSTDVNKAIYNTSDRTWSLVIAFVSTSQLTLDRDAFPDGDESYRMYNKGCVNNLQVNIEDITDYIGADHGVVRVDYLDSQRNFTIDGDILEFKYEIAPDDSADSDADTELLVWFEVRHRISQLTDLAGATTAIVAAGATSVPLDGFSGSEIVVEGTEFTIAGIRGKYRVTADVTLSTGAGTVVVYPPLESAAAENDVITIEGSTLSPKLEAILVHLTAGRTGRSKARSFINQVDVGGIGLYNRYRNLGSEIPSLLAQLTRGVKPKSKHSWPRD